MEEILNFCTFNMTLYFFHFSKMKTLPYFTLFRGYFRGCKTEMNSTSTCRF